MLDIRYIREHKEELKRAIKDKRLDLDLDRLVEVDNTRRFLITEVEKLQEERNKLSAKVSQATDDHDRQFLIEGGQKIKQKIEKLEEQLKEVLSLFDKLMILVPTIPAPDTPPGESDQDNVEVYRWGEIAKFDFKPLDHFELGKKLDIIDFERGAKVAGYRGYYIKNEGVMLVMGLMMFALNKMVQKGYKPFIPPTLIKEFVLFGSGYFKGLEYNDETDEIYQIASSDKEESGEKSKDKKFLIGTAEPSLLAYYSGETLKEKDLPIKFCGFSQCYRSEIGSYGKDTKGLYRVHEFFKVEQVVLAKNDLEASDKLQEEMVEITKKIHEELGLPYRVIRICGGDLSAGKYKQFDYEVWMPGLNRWGETGSASNFLTWQSKRLDVKYEKEDRKKDHVIMLNNTALPSPRPLIAILENFQQKDGSVRIPEVLVPYTGFSVITSK